MNFMAQLKDWLAERGTSWRVYPIPVPVAVGPNRRPQSSSTNSRPLGPGDRAQELLAREIAASDRGEAYKKRSARPRHSLIAATRVNGVGIIGRDGDHVGHIRDLSIDKRSGRIIYALVGLGGFLGMAENIYPVPWSLLSYDPEKEGYRVPFEKAAIKGAPGLTSEDLEWFGAGDEVWRLKSAGYYSAYSYMRIP
jgi:sporulation protein YlmC with PRC-barrel domain